MPYARARQPLAASVAVRTLPRAPEPVRAFRAFVNDPYPFFLDSGQRGPEWGEFSYIGSQPFLILTVKGRAISETHCHPVPHASKSAGNAFRALGRMLARYRLQGEWPVPFPTGAVGYFGYDLCHHVERLPACAADDIQFPDLHFAFYDHLVVFDHVRDCCLLVASDWDDSRGSAEARLDALEEKVLSATPPAGRIAAGPISANFTKDGYLAAVRRAKEYIAAGDIFQVNLSQRFHARFEGRACDLYQRLRQINPAPFAAYLGLDGERAVVCASPELFLRVRGRRVLTRPIKGTRRRAQDPLTDARLRAELLASEKDAAELAMIVDLERNDLGRVCEYGSVQVSQPRVLESFPTVHHLVATVEGRLHPRYDLMDLLRATFPGGSITGAPKIRAMEIIDELEPTRRSVYTGALGFIGFNGSLDLNIVIRTILVRGQDIFFQAGGGIVADSDPEAEYEETLDKARALIAAVSGTA